MIDSFLTQQVVTKAANATGSAAASLQGELGGGPNNPAQIAFMELLNAQLAENAATRTEAVAEDAIADENASSTLNIAQILATSPEIEEQAEQITAQLGNNPTQGDLLGAIGQVLALNQQAFDAITKPLVTDKITAEQSLFETGSASIYDLALENGLDHSLLQTLNLDQVSQIAQALQQIELNAEAGGSDINGVGVLNLLQSIVPDLAIAQNVAPSSQPLAIVPSGAETLPLTDQAQRELATQLNALTPGDAPVDGENADFEEILQRLQNGTKTGKTGSDAADITGKLKVPGGETSHVLPALPSIQALTPLTNGGLGTPLDGLSSADGLYGISSAGGTALQSAQGLSGMITQSYSAGQPHPATQMVAMTMKKAGADGLNKSITLQLDPPELGRVEVRMTFGKDKIVKTVLSVEKPETLSMLQRDAHTLEKAMNDIGLDANGGVDLELAQDNHNFDQDGRHDGSRNQARAGGASDVENTELLIIPQPDLYIDPTTGLVRFDFVA